MVDKMNGGLAARIAIPQHHCCGHGPEKSKNEDKSVDKLDKVFDFLNELTKKLKDGKEGPGSDLVIPKTTGDKQGGYLNPSKQGELDDLAAFMDKKNAENPGTYPCHNAGGKEGDSWKSELGGKTDNFLNAQELGALQQAAKDMAAEKANKAEGAQGGSKSDSILQLLEKLVSMLEQAAGKGGKDGAEGAGKGEGAENAKGAGGKGGLDGILEALQKMIQEMKPKNALDDLMSRIKDLVGGGADGAKGAEAGKGAGEAKGAGESGMSGQLMEILKLLMELIKMMQGEGKEGAEGKGGAGGAGGLSNDPALSQDKMNKALVQTGQGDAYANPSEQQTLDKVAGFMDKNTNVFGKPEGGGSWADALQGEKNVNKQDNSTVQDAMKMMQMLMELLGMLEKDGKEGKGDFQTTNTQSPAQQASKPEPAAANAAQPGQAGGAEKPAQSNGPEGTNGAAGAYKPSSAENVDAGKAPEGMPQDKWQLCVNSAEKTGADPFVLAAQMERESKFGNPEVLANSPSGGDGLMQVEPSTRAAYEGEFSEKFGKPYDHSSEQDQVDMAGMILAGKQGDTAEQLRKYNGGDNYAAAAGGNDSFGRTTHPHAYADGVLSMADKMRASVEG